MQNRVKQEQNGANKKPSLRYFPPFLAANASLCVCTEGKTQEFIFNKYINESRLEYALFGGPKLYNSYKFYLHESFFI